MYILFAIAVMVGLWVGYCFVQGFIQGFCEGWQRARWRRLRGVWRQCKRENPRRDL